jgi:hypothetical protein
MRGSGAFSRGFELLFQGNELLTRELLVPGGPLPWAFENPPFRLKWKGLLRHSRENRLQRFDWASVT